ncbi:glutathione hydrolase 1 proenzyme-like [Neodiprion fabricii]|uniref:glutathione hydrolase 1 proenzyme-like n=1 Tax=Neodiprion fabricii TaxID=2872261 RepID=UPI001ED97FBB|nr:glutathione hydrolase 1 proenzyme-like [Neodiprion fabricii]
MIGSKKKLLVAGIGAVVIIVIIVIVILVATAGSGDDDSSDGKYVSDSVLGRYSQAAVTTNGQECAQIGSDILARNGSAIDAAIAALLCEGVACLHSMGLGGGFFMTIWDAATESAYYLDARETAPSLATQNMYGGNSTLSMYGGLAVAVPGELLGYWEAHQKFGRLPWVELFNATIELCEEGSIVTDYLAAYLETKKEQILAEPTMAEILINPDTGSVWLAGDRIKRPKLAETLKIISEQGADVFYNGTIGEQLAEEVQAFGGILQMDDLRNYSVIWKEPTESMIGNYTMYSAPPPGSGVILTFIMNVLENLIPVDEEEIMWQRIVETYKWAYARRTELGDPDFVDIADLVANFTSSDYADSIREMIKDDWTSLDPLFYGAVTSGTRESGTAHISVLAPDGSAVSVTSTINQVLGAMIRSNSTGIIFNDEMDDFSSPNITNSFGLPASPANYIEPGKRPLSSMIPTILVDENKKVRLVIGGAGGTKIISGTSIAMLLNLWLGYDIKEAVDARRLHHQLYPMTIQNENGFSSNVLAYLEEIGHTTSTYSGLGSAITGISVQDGSVTANSDYRRQGVVAGY